MFRKRRKISRSFQRKHGIGMDACCIPTAPTAASRLEPSARPFLMGTQPVGRMMCIQQRKKSTQKGNDECSALCVVFPCCLKMMINCVQLCSRYLSSFVFRERGSNEPCGERGKKQVTKSKKQIKKQKKRAMFCGDRRES